MSPVPESCRTERTVETLLRSVASMAKILCATSIVFIHISSCGRQPEAGEKAPPRVENGVIDLMLWDFEKDGPIQLDGDWRFYWKELLRSIDIKENQPYEKITVPGIWNDFTVNGQKIGPTGYATYRLQIQLPEAQNQLGLRLQSIPTNYELEINGKRIYQNGKVGKDSSNSILSKAFRTIALPLNSNSFDIVLRVSNFHDKEGGLRDPLVIGSLARLEQSELNQIYIEWCLIGILAIMGMYHLGLYFIRRKDASPLYFGIFSLIMTLRSAQTGSHFLYNISPDHIHWLLYKIEYLTFYLALPVFLLYTYSLFSREFHRYAIRLIIVVCLLFSIFVTAVPSVVFTRFLTWFQIFALAAGLYTIVSITLAILRKRESSALFLSAWMLFFAAVINDILNNNLIINTGDYFHFGFIAFIFLQSYLLSRRFSKAFNTVEKQSLELAKLAGVKDEFLANLSHELRTPLTAIHAYGEMFEHNDDPADMKEYGREIFVNSEKLIGYVDDLMLLTRMETALDTSRVETDIKEIINENIDKINKLSVEKNISIQNKGEISDKIQADRKLLSKAIHAIIKNAVIYNRENGSVIVATEIHNGMLKITVSDTGIGISPRHLPLIFDRFYRVDSSDTYEVSGVGVGLFLAKKIIEMHGGSISVESEMGRGSQFTVELPLN